MQENKQLFANNVNQVLLHGPPLLVDKTNFGLFLYNHANFYRFEETSSYWSVNRISVSLSRLFIGQPAIPPASLCVTVQ